jgi:hypothetical protein
MPMVIRFILTVVFGLLWWWVYTFAGVHNYLVLLGSLITLCACCCQGREPPSEWNWDRYLACLRRCVQALWVLMVALFVIGVIVHFITAGVWPPAADLVKIIVAAIGSVIFIRAICCAYDS